MTYFLVTKRTESTGEKNKNFSLVVSTFSSLSI